MDDVLRLNITQDIHHGATIIFICCVLIIIASFIDMWTGIDAARANKEPIRSRALRKTVSKIIDYLRVVFFAVLIDVLGLFFPWYAIPYCVIIGTLGILLIEFRSVIENSKKKRSQAGEVVDMVARIIECATDKDAEKIIEFIKKTNMKPRGLGNNNPGNIRINGDKFQGEVIPSRDKEFKQFESMAYGYRAIFKILRNYRINYKLDTIRKMIHRWAPENENNTNSYINVVSDRSGIPADDPIDTNSKEQMTRIVAAMSYVENGTEADMNDVIAGWDLL